MSKRIQFEHPEDCPFCGHKAEIKFIGLRQCDYWKGRIAAVCTNCGAEAGKSAYRGLPIMGDILKSPEGMLALKAWNRRYRRRKF